MIIDFTIDEKKLLRGLSSKVAKKHSCTKKYVLDVLNGDTKFTTELQFTIYNDLRDLVNILKSN